MCAASSFVAASIATEQTVSCMPASMYVLCNNSLSALSRSESGVGTKVYQNIQCELLF